VKKVCQGTSAAQKAELAGTPGTVTVALPLLRLLRSVELGVYMITSSTVIVVPLLRPSPCLRMYCGVIDCMKTSAW
jgi:hypothetical protein